MNEYIELDDYYILKITQKNGQSVETKISKDKIEEVKKYKWYIGTHGYITYSKRTEIHLRLHNLIMNFQPSNGYVVDHINRDKLDNRTENLRICHIRENSRNTNAKGVSFDKSRNKWLAQVMFNRKHYGKRFDTYEEALKYRKFLEKKYFGIYAPKK